MSVIFNITSGKGEIAPEKEMVIDLKLLKRIFLSHNIFIEG